MQHDTEAGDEDNSEMKGIEINYFVEYVNHKYALNFVVI